MIRIDFKEYRKYIVFALIILVIYITYLLIKPILIPILTGAVLAYIFYPIYKTIYKKIKMKSISAVLVSILVILLIVIPSFFLLNTFSKEIYQAFIIIKQRIGIGVIAECADKTTPLCNIINTFKQYTTEPGFQFYLEQGLGKLTSSITEAITGFVFSIPRRILDVFITFFVMYYLFKDGNKIISKIKDTLPVDKAHQEIIINKSKSITFGVIYGTILVALIQGVLGAFGFYIFGISTPLFWGILIAFLALIPMVGASLIYLPAALILIARGYLGAGGILIWKGIGLILYGLLIVSSVENFAKPRIISGKAKVHPITALIGVIGGIALFGFIGILIGPLLLSLLIIIVEIYQKNEIKS